MKELTMADAKQDSPALIDMLLTQAKDTRGLRKLRRTAFRLSNAEKQMRFREHMKEEGFKRIVRWVPEDDTGDMKDITNRIHKSSIGICSRDEKTRQVLSYLMKAVEDLASQGSVSQHVFEDLRGLCAVFDSQENPKRQKALP
jgi:hypothetical protein